MDQIEQKPQNIFARQYDYYNNFQSDCSTLARYAALFHGLQYLLHIKQNLSGQLPETLRSQHLKQIRAEDTSECINQKIGRQYDELVGQRQTGQELTQDDIFAMVINTFKPELVSIVSVFLVQGICRVSFSMIVYRLLQAVSSLSFQTAYILIPFLIVLQYLSHLLRLTGFLNSALLSSQIKVGLSMLLYRKISSINSYQIKSSPIGKITNLLSSDLAAIDQRIVYLLMSCSLPVVIIAVTALLIALVGWAAFLGVVIVTTLLPISGLISKHNGDIIRKANVHKDERILATSESIEGIKHIKLYGWQLAFKRKVQQVRQLQIGYLKEVAFYRAIQRGICDTISNLATFVMILTAWKVTERLSFAVIFSVLQIMSSLKFYAICCQNAIGIYYELRVIFQRFATVLSIRSKPMICINSSILCQKQSNRQETKKGDIFFTHFSAYQKEDFQEPVLKDVNYHFQTHTLYGITGKVGSGKSTLLAAILGEIPYYSGSLKVCGDIAYVEQEPTIVCDTVRNNILFGRPFDQGRYDEVVKLTCLASDFKILGEGDLTIVGERGQTLSGGQRARLSLARALYAEADIYLLDDPMSSVDGKVGNKIFRNCIKPLSQRKTVLLVTHQIGYYEACDKVLMVDNGSIQCKSVKVSMCEMKEMIDERSEVEDEVGYNMFEQNQQRAHQQIIQDNLHKMTQQSRFNDKRAELSLMTYTTFLFANHLNYIVAPFIILSFLSAEISIAYFYRTLTEFNSSVTACSSHFVGSSHFEGNQGLFWGTLALLLLTYLILNVTKHFLLNISILNSATSIHESMLEGILRSPSSFFDQTSSGMLVNNFSNDLGLLDRSLIFSAKDAFEVPVSIIVATYNLCQICPTITIPAVIIFSIAILFFSYARPAILSCRQLDLQHKSPIFNFFNESIMSSIQIKITHQQQSKFKELSRLIDKSTKATIAYDVVSRGFAFYLFVITVLLMTIGLILAVIKIDTSNNNNNEQFGVIIIYLISITDGLQFSFRQVIAAEGIMVSAARTQQLQNLCTEASLRTIYDESIGLKQEVLAAQQEQHTHQVWPRNPNITLQNLSARYRQGLPLILKDISFNVKSGEKIGIVGCTGAGKSSIVQALFRIFETEVGSIYQIGGFNALQMGLHSLRQHISIIPQVPFLFRGTVRQNLDPFSVASDQQIWKVFDATSLSDHIKQLDKHLQTQVSNRSDVFSVGQKQLLCLARVLLQRNRLLVLDEATSNVDMGTDALIQGVLKERFQDTTMITIAHRLNTITDYDRVLVMKAGRVVEEGPPYELVERRGLFFEMMQNAGIKLDVMTRGTKNLSQLKNI